MESELLRSEFGWASGWDRERENFMERERKSKRVSVCECDCECMHPCIIKQSREKCVWLKMEENNKFAIANELHVHRRQQNV